MTTPAIADREAAGRELDAMIAEKVMGFTWRRAPRRDVSLKGLIPPDEMEAWSDLMGDEAVARDYFRFCPRYSTDIAPAWLVVEKMRERGCDVSLSVEKEGCRVIVFAADTDYVVWFGEPSPTAPLAICLAALAANSTDLVDAEP